MFKQVLVFDIDQQWVSDLVEVQTLSKHNKGFDTFRSSLMRFPNTRWLKLLKRRQEKLSPTLLPRYSNPLIDVNLDHCRQIQKRILQSSLSKSVETTEHSSLFYSESHVFQCRRSLGKSKKKKKKPPAFKVGDKRRLNKKFRPFKKGYLPGWTEEVFVVREVVPGMTTTCKV